MSAELNIIFSDGGTTSQSAPASPAQPSSPAVPANSPAPPATDSPVTREPGEMDRASVARERPPTEKPDSGLQAINQLGQKIADTAGVGNLYKSVTDFIQEAQRALSSSTPRDERGALPSPSAPSYARPPVPAASPSEAQPESAGPELPRLQSPSRNEPASRTMPEGTPAPASPDQLKPELPRLELPSKPEPSANPAENLVDGVVDGMGAARGAEQLGSAARGAAATGIEAAAGATEAATAGLSALASTTIVTEAGLKVATAAANTMASAVNAAAATFNDLVAQTRDYSAAVANATARTQVREELAAIRRANLTGGNVAQLENLRSKANDELAKIMDNIYKAFTDFALENKDLIQAAIDTLTIIAQHSAAGAKAAVDTAAKSTEMSIALSGGPVGVASVLFAKAYPGLVKYLKKATEEKDEPDNQIDPFAMAWMEAMRNPMAGAVGDEAP